MNVSNVYFSLLFPHYTGAASIFHPVIRKTKEFCAAINQAELMTTVRTVALTLV
jgi:hypothetical protein